MDNFFFLKKNHFNCGFMTDLPPFHKSNIDNGRVVVDKLQGEEFEGDAVIILFLCT